jgi:hypothetical protein
MKEQQTFGLKACDIVAMKLVDTDWGSGKWRDKR